MNSRHILILLFVSLLQAGYLPGQELAEDRFDHYTTAKGMSHNAVTAIAQDSAGYMWIGTSYGLNRFDGTRFVQFRSNSDSLSLPANDVAGMNWLDDRRLAVFSGGVHIEDTKTGLARNVLIPYHNKQYQFKYNMIVNAMGDKEGHVYILSRSGFYHYDKNYTLVSRFDFYSEEEVPVTHFYFGRGLFELDKNRLLIVSIGGLFIYDKGKKQVRKMGHSDCPLFDEFSEYPAKDCQFFQPAPGKFIVLKSDSDTILYIDVAANKKTVSRSPLSLLRTEFGWRSKLAMISDTIFYITGHNSGFFKMQLNSASGALKLYPAKYFGAYLCTGLLKDKDRSLWVATSRGLFRQNPRRAFLQVAALPAGIEDRFPNIYLDDIFVSGNKVFAGARGDAGLFVFDKKTLQLDKHIFFNVEEYRVNHVRAMARINPSTLMIGTLGPLLSFDEATHKVKKLDPPGWVLPGSWTSDLYRDRKDNIWISSGMIYKYSTRTKEFTVIPNLDRLLSVPFWITEDTAGHIWMAGHGLARYNTVLDSFDLFLDSFPFIKMPDKQIGSMVIDSYNTIWFNSNNNGLTGYDIDKGTYRHFTRSHGLPDDNIASMIVVGNQLWLAGYSGIACLDLRTSQIVSFGKEDGFPEMPVVKGARFFYDEEEAQLYIGYSTAIVRFNPIDILRRKSPPRVFIENLVISNKRNDFLPGHTITTSWRDNEIMITTGSINFSDGYNQGFAYRIYKDETTPWQPAASQPSFNISNLSPGTHRVQVKVFSLDNRWPPQVKEISIVVLPPFWKRDWFIILLFVAVPALLYWFVTWRTGAARKKEMEKTHIQKLIADDYKSQFELEQISNYFSSSLAGKRTTDEVLWDVARNLIGRMNYVDCMIYLWNEDKTKMVQKAAFGPKGNPEYIASHVFDVVPGQGVVGYVMRTMLPVLIPDTRKDSRYRMDEMFRLSEICVPIIHNNKLLGIIDSEHHELNYFKERDLKILTTIATLIGNKLKQLESEQTLEVKHLELANINEQLAEAKLVALQAQMNPHFVFNALNSIKRMILDGDNERASRYLSKFALMIRMTLNHSKDAFVTLDESIKYLETYLEMERLRFDDSFTYKIITEDNIDACETAIPSLMIQPLVENAIWHGLLPSADDKKVVIGFSQDQQKITCTIEDNGIGIRQSEKLKQTARPSHQSMGLENLQKRIKIMNEKYDTDCTLEITDLKSTGANGSGTKVILQFNCINM
ncbi:MAG: histidine kinase [Chitinophagaceae bacterium]|nr:histidine kinase [Chitinophagaceae bacterium]